MRIRLIHVTTRRSGRQARRPEELDANALTVGRGTDNMLTLGDLAVSIRHAIFREQADGVYVEGMGAAEVRVSGRRIRGETRVRPGTTVTVGPYALRIVEPDDDHALQLEVEEVERRGDEYEGLAQRTRSGVERGWFTRRVLSWIGAIAVLAIFLAIPLASGRLGSWNSGPISRKHAVIAGDCASCHRGGFEVVRDGDCLACHSGIERHTRAEVRVASLEQTRCATCHAEHNSGRGLAALEQSLCVGCHADLRAVHAGVEISNVSDFGDEHPEFRIQLVGEPGAGDERGVRERVTWSPALVEHSGLKFNHLRHVGQVVAHPDGTKEALHCGRCHQFDAAGQYTVPIAFERHCQECHALSFDPAFGERQALHGAPAVMRQDLREAYAGRVYQGEETALEAPGVIRFLRPGQQVSEMEREIVDAWVNGQVKRAEQHLFDEPGECARCHEIRPDGASDGGRSVAPVEVAAVWMPASIFGHETHAPFACARCHAAAAVFDPEDAPELKRSAWSLPNAGSYALVTPEELERTHGRAPSERSDDVLVPGIETCRSCHGGAYDGPPLVASECVVCHPFHREGHGAMRARNATGSATGTSGPG
ncbi:MAG: FHA domain-containing protein [Myxococcota bacterium]